MTEQEAIVLSASSAAFVGTLLAHYLDQSALRKERKMAYGRAMTYLLKALKVLRAFRLAEAQLKDSLPVKRLSMIREFSQDTFELKGLSDKYNSSVDVIAAMDPFLAYELLSKENPLDSISQVADKTLAENSLEELKETKDILRAVVTISTASDLLVRMAEKRDSILQGRIRQLAWRRNRFLFPVDQFRLWRSSRAFVKELEQRHGGVHP